MPHMWTEMETRMVLNLYIEYGVLSLGDQRVINLSGELNISPGSIRMKLQNFASLDPMAITAGLKNASNLDKLIWEEHQRTIRRG
ncbi:MAG: hypothetical protein WA666_02505 [Nitrospirota bacterium]